MVWEIPLCSASCMDIVSPFKYITFIKHSHHFQEFQVVPKIPACLRLHQVPDDKRPRGKFKHEPRHYFHCFSDTYGKAFLSTCSSFSLKQQEILKIVTKYLVHLLGMLEEKGLTSMPLIPGTPAGPGGPGGPPLLWVGDIKRYKL